MKRTIVLLFSLFAATALAACGMTSSTFGANPGAEASGNAGIEITGALLDPTNLSVADLMAIDWTTVSVQGQAGAQNYAGIPLNSFLTSLGVSAPEAETINFVSTDGSVISLPVADLQRCTDCLLATSQSGAGLRLILPGMDVNLWAEDVVSAYVE